MGERGARSLVSVGPTGLVAESFKLTLPSRAAATINGTRLLNFTDKTGASAMVVPIVNGSAQTGDTALENVVFDENQVNWAIPTGHTAVDGVTLLAGGSVFRLSKPGIYVFDTYFKFSQSVSTNCLAFVNGALNNQQTMTVSDLVTGGLPNVNVKHTFRMIYGAGTVGNIDISFGLQATNVVGGLASTYTNGNVYITKNEHSLLA